MPTEIERKFLVSDDAWRAAVSRRELYRQGYLASTRLCVDGLVEKYRHWVPFAGHEWEVDEFLGANAGLVVAELELEHEDEAFERPRWLGEEITEDVRYYNSSLARLPYSAWTTAGAAVGGPT